MPVRTIEQIKTREESLKKTLAEMGKDADADKRRGARKRLRRAQRRRRRMAAEQARVAKQQKSGSDAKGQ